MAVKVGAKTLVGGVDYTLTYANNKNAGRGVAIVSGKGDYKGVTFKAFTIAKAKNPIVAKARTVKVKAAKVSKKSVKLARKKAITLKKAQGKVTYKKVKGTKKIAVATKTGKVTVKKGIKKGTYKVKVRVTAAGNNNYKKRTRVVVFKVKVR